MKHRDLEKQLILWLPVILWSSIIFSFSNRPTISASYFDPLDFIIKKAAHLTEYAILFSLIFRAFYQSWYPKKGIDYWENMALISTLIFAISDEWHQSFITGRTATIRDILIDFIGILIGLSIIKWLNKQQKFKIVKKLVYGTK